MVKKGDLWSLKSLKNHINTVPLRIIDDDHNTLLHIAIHNYDIEMFKYVLENHLANPNQANL